MVTLPALLNDSMQATFLTRKPFKFRAVAATVIATQLAVLSLGCDSRQVGPPIPAVVEGDSMAPTIPGAHLAVTCNDCGIDFNTELPDDATKMLTCFNCGHPKIDVTTAKRIAPPVAMIQPVSKWPRRWDVVGFDLPQQKTAGVKRIVGLPNEIIRITNGDLFNGETILRKPWRVQKDIRIPVFDSKFSGIVPYGNSARFRAARNSGWYVSKDLRFDAAQDATLRTAPGTISWLDYVHWRNFRHAGKRDDEFPIEDHYGFNQSAARNLNPTDDLMLRLDLDFVEPDSKFVFAFRRGVQEYAFVVSYFFASNSEPGKLQLEYDGQSKRKPLQFKTGLKADSPKATFEFSSFDRALHIKLNGSTVFELREDEAADPIPPTSSLFDDRYVQSFRIGGKQGAFRVERLQIWRDVFYLPKDGKLEAGPESYILLGDNVPRSLDSRDWKIPGVNRQQILGTLGLTDSEAE